MYQVKYQTSKDGFKGYVNCIGTSENGQKSILWAKESDKVKATKEEALKDAEKIREWLEYWI